MYPRKSNKPRLKSLKPQNMLVEELYTCKSNCNNSIVLVRLVSVALVIGVIAIAIDARYSIVASFQAGFIEFNIDGKPNN